MAKRKPGRPRKTPDAPPEPIDEKVEEDLTDETADAAEEIFDDPASKSGVRIEVQRVPSKSEEHEWDYYWMLYSGNGQQIATGVHPHNRLGDLKTTVSRIAGYINTAPFIRLY